MKTLLLFLVILLSHLNYSFSQETNDLAILKLKGKIISIAEFKFYIDSLSGSEILADSITTLYNEQGNIKEKRECLLFCSITTYTYNNEGKLAETSTKRNDGLFIEKTIYKRDKDSLSISVYDQDNNFIESESFKYSLKKDTTLLQEIDEKVPSGTPETTIKYTDYDNYGNWLKENVFEDGKLVGGTKRKIVYH